MGLSIFWVKTAGEEKFSPAFFICFVFQLLNFMMSSFFECGRFRFAMKPTMEKPIVKPVIMGILNATPDSFSDGGRFQTLDNAISHAEQMIADGVDIIDIGGESSRPGAQPLPFDEELKRVMPLIFALRDCGKAISVDTYK